MPHPSRADLYSMPDPCAIPTAKGNRDGERVHRGGAKRRGHTGGGGVMKGPAIEGRGCRQMSPTNFEEKTSKKHDAIHLQKMHFAFLFSFFSFSRTFHFLPPLDTIASCILFFCNVVCYLIYFISLCLLAYFSLFSLVLFISYSIFLFETLPFMTAIHLLL